MAVSGGLRGCLSALVLASALSTLSISVGQGTSRASCAYAGEATAAESGAAKAADVDDREATAQERARATLGETHEVRSKLEELASVKLLHPDVLPDWVALLRKGAPVTMLQEVRNYDVTDLHYRLAAGHHPASWLQRHGTREDFTRYSQAMADKDPYATKDIKELQMHLIERLKQKKHIERTDGDYDEGTGQIKDIKDKTLLVLLKQRLDALESPAMPPFLENLFSTGNEEGGINFGENGTVTFYQIPNIPDNGEEKRSYRVPRIRYHIPNLGVFHTHPKGKFDGDHAGPSGGKRADWSTHNDSFVLFFTSPTNIYEIDLVFSDLGEKDGARRCNADAYFVDPKTRDKKVKDLRMRVIDLGVYEIGTPRTAPTRN